MIAGIGTDLVQISRMEKSLCREGFLHRVFGSRERALLDDKAKPAQRLQTAAANFAAKEAFGKALGSGILREFSLCEVQALRDENGAPYFALSGKAAEICKERKLKAHLSLTHEGAYAAAFVVLESQDAST